MYILNYKGALVDIEKADCIYKSQKFIDGRTCYRIETDNGAKGDGFVLGEYWSKEERDRVFENMMAFLSAMDMRKFEEDND